VRDLATGNAAAGLEKQPKVDSKRKTRCMIGLSRVNTVL